MPKTNDNKKGKLLLQRNSGNPSTLDPMLHSDVKIVCASFFHTNISTQHTTIWQKQTLNHFWAKSLLY
jgi:hypothetical protein